MRQRFAVRATECGFQQLTQGPPPKSVDAVRSIFNKIPQAMQAAMRLSPRKNQENPKGQKTSLFGMYTAMLNWGFTSLSQFQRLRCSAFRCSCAPELDVSHLVFPLLQDVKGLKGSALSVTSKQGSLDFPLCIYYSITVFAVKTTCLCAVYVTISLNVTSSKDDVYRGSLWKCI